MLKLPIGYRYLKVGEIVKVTDFYNASSYGVWVSCKTGVGHRLNTPIKRGLVEFCRQDKTPQGNTIADEVL